MYCKNYWFYWFYLYCFVIFPPCIPSLPIPSHPFPSTFVPSFPILPHLTPPYHTLFFSFLFHFIPHCPIPPYFFLPMYSSVLLLFPLHFHLQVRMHKHSRCVVRNTSLLHLQFLFTIDTSNREVSFLVFFWWFRIVISQVGIVSTS